MRTLLAVLGILLLVGVASAEKKAQEPISILEVECGYVTVCQEWNFGTDNGGFTAPNSCDPTGGAAVWQHGVPTIPAPPAPYGPTVWGTTIGGNYPNDAGDGLLSPSFTVTGDCYLMEILHYVHVETNFDGGNVTVNNTVIPPTDSYPATISTSTSYYAFCTEMEGGFTGNGSTGASEVWTRRCFDLSAYTGQTIQVRFDFGSDSSVTYPGWYLAYVKLGGLTGNPTERSTWGHIKSFYR